MKKELLLIVLLLAVGCESKKTQTVSPDKNLIPVHPPITGVSFSGGDGSSIEKAVIITAPNKFTGVRAEFDWIQKNRRGWQFERQSVLKGRGKVLDKMVFRTPQGEPVTLFFDITDFNGKK